MFIAVIMQTAPLYFECRILVVFWWMDLRSILSSWFSPMHLWNPWIVGKVAPSWQHTDRQSIGSIEVSVSSWCNKRDLYVPQLKGLAQLLTANWVFQRYYWCCKNPSPAKNWPVFWLIAVPVEIGESGKVWAYFTLLFHSWPLLDF